MMINKQNAVIKSYIQQSKRINLQIKKPGRSLRRRPWVSIIIQRTSTQQIKSTLFQKNAQSSLFFCYSLSLAYRNLTVSILQIIKINQMTKKYVVLLINRRKNKIYTDDLKNVHRVDKRIKPQIPAFQSSHKMDDEQTQQLHIHQETTQKFPDLQ